MANAVVRLDNMAGTTVGTLLRSVKFYADGAEKEIQNGAVVKLEALIDREVYKAVAPAANTPINEVVLVASPEVMYDERKRNLEDFINEAGDVARGYMFHTGDVFSVTAEALTAAPAIGWAVELAEGTKMAAVETATEGATQIGKVIAVEVVSGKTFYVICVA